VSRDDAVVVEKFTSRMEAEMAAGLLEAEGIQAFVSADDAGGAYPQLQSLRGVELIVFPEDEDRAREILGDWRQGQALEDDEEIPE
jgi:hypothetical protein